MRKPWFAAIALGWLLAGPLAAQPPGGERAIELPPLLPPPQGTPAPIESLTVPSTGFDPGHLYLPETNPTRVKLPPCPCRPLGRTWIIPTLELGWSKPQQVPSTVLTGDGAGTRVAYGNQSLGQTFRTGFGLSGGAWLDRCQNRGVDASFYYLAEGTTDYTLFSPGSTSTLYLPVLAGNNGPPALFHLAGPDVGNGAHQVYSETKYQTADANYRRNLFCETDVRLDALVGYRYAHLGEGLHLYNKQIAADDNLIRTKDHISAANQFHAGQIGLSGEYRVDSWYLDLTGKVAFGRVFTTSDAEGAFRVNGVVDPFGFYTRPAVSGERTHGNFAVMPTVNVALGRQLGEHGRVFVGYAFQYLSRVTRPSDVYVPVPVLNGTGEGMSRDGSLSDFWAQSVNLGVEWRY